MKRIGNGRTALATAAILLLGACGADEEANDNGETELVEDDPAGIVIETLSATIGADGGSLQGEPGTAFEGFSLVVPAGALTDDTLIEVSGVVDPTPLAATAARVGPQFAIAPSGLELAVPASVTVPYDHVLRDAWDVPDSDCRVWFRDGEGWSNAAQTSSTADGVTVEIPLLSTVAAGVFSFSRPMSCLATGTCPPSVGDQGCLVGDTFCLTRLVPPSVAAWEFSSVNVESGFAYFLTSPGTNQFAIAKYDLASTNGATTTTVPLSGTPSRSVSTRGRVAVEPNGNLWLGLVGYGNVRFRPSASANRFETSTSTSPQGVVYQNAPIRFVLRSASTDRELAGFNGTNEVITLPVSSVDTPISAIASRNDIPTTRSVFTTGVAVATSRSGTFPTPRGTSGNFRDVCGSALTQSGTLDASNAHQAVGCGSNEVASSVLSGRINVGQAVSSLAIDDQENVFVIDQSIAQITRVDAEGGVTTVALTDAAPGTPANERMLPRAIRYEPGFDMLVLFTKGTNSSGAPDIYLIEAFRD
ncbi:MAG: hypothetical protein H6700_06815 [Myxococcales bacterium]|nr:hypothetical protein [Myxococcales bacterium]MCB9531459.1 hypothetical protein [Myxococcales bacterium]